MQSTLHLEDSVPFITNHDSNLETSTTQVNLGELMSSHQHVKHTIKSWYGNLYLIVILLMTQQSIHILQESSFLGTNKARMIYRLMHSLIKSFRKSPLTCLFNLAHSRGFI